MLTVFALTLIFSDGYVGGSSHVQDFKNLTACNKKGSAMALQYTSWGHPASFICSEVKVAKNQPKPEPVNHVMQTLPAG